VFGAKIVTGSRPGCPGRARAGGFCKQDPEQNVHPSSPSIFPGQPCAQAGIQGSRLPRLPWAPAFAGATDKFLKQCPSFRVGLLDETNSRCGRLHAATSIEADISAANNDEMVR